MNLKLYTDGSCKQKELSKPGAWAFMLTDEQGIVLHKESKFLGPTSNNEAELTALKEGLSFIASNIGRSSIESVEVLSDSAYVMNPLKNHTVDTWKATGWRTSMGTIVNHKGLWEDILDAIESINGKGGTNNIPISYTHVEGHADCKGNLECDRMAAQSRVLGPNHDFVWDKTQEEDRIKDSALKYQFTLTKLNGYGQYTGVAVDTTVGMVTAPFRVITWAGKGAAKYIGVSPFTNAVDVVSLPMEGAPVGLCLVVKKENLKLFQQLYKGVDIRRRVTLYVLRDGDNFWVSTEPTSDYGVSVPADCPTRQFTIYTPMYDEFPPKSLRYSTGKATKGCLCPVGYGDYVDIEKRVIVDTVKEGLSGEEEFLVEQEETNMVLTSTPNAEETPIHDAFVKAEPEDPFIGKLFAVMASLESLKKDYEDSMKELEELRAFKATLQSMLK